MSINPSKTSEEIIVRAINRGFVGLPTCTFVTLFTSYF